VEVNGDGVVDSRDTAMIVAEIGAVTPGGFATL
jgi:hypothetical protein